MNPYRYCGEYFDEETGFTYLRAGYYDAKIGWFISEDPALDGLNWYAYCGNELINGIDPTRELAVAIKIGIDVIAILITTMKATVAASSAYLIKVVYDKATGEKRYYYASSKEVAKPQPGPKPSMKPKSKGKSGVKKKEKTKSVDDLLKDAKPGRKTKGKAKQWEKGGGYNKALRDFEKLGVKDVKDIPGGKTGKLPDGRKINVRNKSSDGRPTLEIQDPKGSIKIRYK